AVAGLVRMLAGLLARGELEHAQRQRPGAERGQRVECEPASRALGAEEADLVELLPGAGLQQREDRADGLADARWRLRRQAAPQARGAEHRFGERALAGAEGGVGEGERLERAVTLGAVRQLAVGPRQEAVARRFEEALQVGGGAALLEAGLVLRADVV